MYGQTRPYTTGDVHERLDRDAHVRMSLPRSSPKYVSPKSLAGFTTGSGWKTNWKWDEIYAKSKPQASSDPALLSLHPITLKTYQKARVGRRSACAAATTLCAGALDGEPPPQSHTLQRAPPVYLCPASAAALSPRTAELWR